VTPFRNCRGGVRKPHELVPLQPTRRGLGDGAIQSPRLSSPQLAACSGPFARHHPAAYDSRRNFCHQSVADHPDASRNTVYTEGAPMHGQPAVLDLRTRASISVGRNRST